MFELTKQIGGEAATVAADRLLGFFPTIAASDPAVFLTGLVQILAAYPADVIESVLSPLSGLPSKHKFMPSLAEVKAECEEHFAPIRRAMARPQPLPRLPAPTTPRPTMAELRAKCGPNWGLSEPPRRRVNEFLPSRHTPGATAQPLGTILKKVLNTTPESVARTAPRRQRRKRSGQANNRVNQNA